MLFTRWLFRGVITAAVLCAAAGHAAEGPEAVTGIWVILQAGQEAGRETFTIRPLPKGAGWEHASEARLALRGAGLTLKAALETDAEGKPRRYALEVLHDPAEGKSPQRVNVAFGETSLTAEVEGAGEPLKKSDAYESVPFLLDNNFFSHYHHLIRHIIASDKERQAAFVYVPQALMMTHALVTREADEETPMAGREVRLHKIFLNVGGMVGLNVYYDAAGEPVKMDIPLQQVVALREGYEPMPVGFAAASAPSPRPTDIAAEEAAAVMPALREVSASFRNGAVRLAGTLLLPPAPEGGARRQKYPAAVILSGSGPQNRDGNTPGGGGLSGSFYRLIAERLARKGFAVLRYDDRGTGESTGAGTEPSVSGIKGDAAAAVRWLRAQKEVERGDVTVIGHSEGAILAMMLAAEKTPGVSRLVLLGGPCSSLREVLREQAELVPEGELREVARRAQDELFAQVDSGRKTARIQGHDVSLRWFREHFAVRPCELARRVRVPVLILHAFNDRQVLRHHAEELHAALAASGAPVQFQILEGLDHLYLPSEDGSIGEYGRARSYGAEPFASLEAWMVEKRGD